MLRLFCFLCIFVLFLAGGCARIPRPAPISASRLPHLNAYPEHEKELVEYALNFSRKKLDYHFGSNDPKRGGMDCSGIIQYMLQRVAELRTPRSAYLIYLWAEKNGNLHHVRHAYYLNSPQFEFLKPGDLLFWTGTYHTHHKPPISHVMMYLGKDRQNIPLMFGATEGTRGYHIVRGVGVFDFTLPSRAERAKFVAYGCIPSYTCGQ